MWATGQKCIFIRFYIYMFTRLPTFCYGFPQNFNSHSGKLNLIHCRLVCQPLSRKEKIGDSICVWPFLWFLLTGKAAVTWVIALIKCHILIDNSFFYETCKNPGYMDFIKICTVINRHGKFMSCLISLLVKLYIHEITIFIVKYFIQRGESCHSKVC